MKEIAEQLDAISTALDNARSDLEKFKEGNKSAGTRVRNSMQEIKEAAQQTRKLVLEYRK